jgi:hypothetical protein
MLDPTGGSDGRWSRQPSRTRLVAVMMLTLTCPSVPQNSGELRSTATIPPGNLVHHADRSGRVAIGIDEVGPGLEWGEVGQIHDVLGCGVAVEIGSSAVELEEMTETAGSAGCDSSEPHADVGMTERRHQRRLRESSASSTFQTTKQVSREP